uniref:Dedicator of cytokinesis protein 7 n=1 Tax=Timema poppense TaxID=170557 RepID=A0A7R9CUK3_TIMPO|nr:unnamed protein product [Timema poppensis]
MASVQRAFAQKLSNWPTGCLRTARYPSGCCSQVHTIPFTTRILTGRRQHAADVRKQISSSYSHSLTKSGSSISGFSSLMSLCDVVDPLDYEEFIQQHQLLLDRDPLHHVLDFPENDIRVGIVPRKIRTLSPVVPEESLHVLPPHVQDCVQSYTADWVVVNYQFRHHSSSSCVRDHIGEKHSLVHIIPRQEFEVDYNNQEFVDTPLENNLFKVDSRQSIQSADTPRGSWASFDLRNSVNDQLILTLLERVPPETVDQLNEVRRLEQRQPFYKLRTASHSAGPSKSSWALLLTSLPFTPVTIDSPGKACWLLLSSPLWLSRVCLTCSEVSQDMLFSLYPAQDEEERIERRIPAENPCDQIVHRILVKCHQLKLELEVEPIFASMALYDAKEKKKVSENFYFDMNSESLKRMLTSHIPYSDVSTLSRSCIFNITYPTTDMFLVIKLEKILQGDINECAEPYMKDDKNRDKVRANVAAASERLGKYRMPFAWTAIYIMNIINGVNSLERESGSDKESGGSNSLDRKSSSSSFDQFRKRASDMSSLTRRGSLERRSNTEKRRSWSPEDFGSSLDSFRPESDRLRDEDLYKFLQDLKRPCSVMKKLKCIPGTLKLDISPCPDELRYCLTTELARLNPYPDEKGRPTKEILEFPLREVFTPHYSYRNLLYVYPKELNFGSRAGSARNIAVKVQLMCGEEDCDALPVIFGKSSCPEFTTEAYTTVSYHNKCPDFYDELKIKLPANLGDHHHLLFTFYHISCQRKVEPTTAETPVGFTWLPIYRDGRLQSGEFCLPVMIERPPPNYSFIPPDVLLPGTKWVDNHKGIFLVTLGAVSSVHAQDKYLDKFLNICAILQDGNIPARIGEANMENELKTSILELTHAKSEPLVKFLPLIMNKLVLLMVKPPTILGQAMNIGQTSFEAITMIVRNVTLKTFFHRSSSNPDIHNFVSGDDAEINSLMRGLDRTSSMRAGPSQENMLYGEPRSHPLKVAHEELALQFLFEMIVKSMVEHLAAIGSLDAPRKMRFCEQFTDDVTTLVNTITSDIISRYNRETKFIHSLNTSLAFFLFDVLSIMDRGYVFFLIKTYYKQMSAKISSLPDAASLVSLKLDFLRIVCSHEHFVALNLPFGTPFTPSSAPASPSLSVCSSASQSSFISTLIGGDKMSFAELSPAFKQQHFLVGLVLSDLASVLEIPSSFLHSKAVNLVRNLMTCHDCDTRYVEMECKARVAALYLPLLGIIMDNLPQLYGYNSDQQESNGMWMKSNTEEIEPRSGINKSVAMAIAGTSTLHSKSKTPENYSTYQQNHKHDLSSETTRNLLICFLWVIKNVDKNVVKQWWMDLPTQRFQQLLEVLNIAISCFEYKGKKSIKHCAPQNLCKTSDIKSRLEDVILGQGSARSEMIMRRKERNPPSNGWPGDRLRWRKEQMAYRPSLDLPGRPQAEVETDAHIEGNLATELTKPLMAYTRVVGLPLLGPQHVDQSINPLTPSWPDSAPSILTSLSTLSLLAHPAGSQLARPCSKLVGFGPDQPPISRLHLTQFPLGFNLTSTTLLKSWGTPLGIEIKIELLEFWQVASQLDNLQCLLGVVLKVLLHALARNQSTCVLQNMFATQRSLVFKFPNLLFDEETEHCADLCLRLLKHCSSSMSSVRSQASASLYLLMRQNFEIGNNFARVKMQVTMSLSSLVGTSSSFSEESLRRSLKTILVYAEEDSDLQDTTFPEQVKDLVFNLHMILSDTVKMKEFQEDPEMLLDLMYRIAKGYQNSPDLRLTWLANMAQKHMERKNHTEAAMCLVHSAALVAEYLHMLEDQPQLPVGAVGLEMVSPNVLEESAVSDDVLSPEEEGVCLGNYFTESGLVGLLEQAASAFHSAGMKLHEAFARIEQLQGKRVFGTYFRVGFYGTKFGDLNGEEFIYKEPTLTKLPEIFSRLENFYAERFGSENVVIIKDSNVVDLSNLDYEKAYIQITYVEPYFESYESRHRITYFERNFNIKKFFYATPFTPNGRAHGELYEQHKRKTILTTANHFPYVKTRIQVVHRKQIVLTPIEVAIEDIEKKTIELAHATQQEPPDPKILQMVLQGCIGTTVNQGPMEIAVVFLSDLSDHQKSPTKFQNKLRLCFKDFSKKCFDALRKNKNLIGQDQRDYQRELERNHQKFTGQLLPLITINNFDKLPKTAK